MVGTEFIRMSSQIKAPYCPNTKYVPNSFKIISVKVGLRMEQLRAYNLRIAEPHAFYNKLVLLNI